MSTNYQYFAFISSASNLVADDTNGAADAFRATIDNKAPTLTTIDTLGTAVKNTDFTITYSTLFDASDAADPNLDEISFRVEAVSGGTLKKNNDAVIEGVTLLGPGESLVWTPTLDQSGVLNAFTTRAWDGQLASATAVQVKVNVLAENHPPQLSNVPSARDHSRRCRPTRSTPTPRTSTFPRRTLTFSLLNGPSGATIDASTGEFHWTPTEAQGPGDYTFSVRVSDGIANTDQSVVLHVAEVNLLPVLTGVPASGSVDELQAFTFDADATDADVPTQNLTFTLVNGPLRGNHRLHDGRVQLDARRSPGPGRLRLQRARERRRGQHRPVDHDPRGRDQRRALAHRRAHRGHDRRGSGLLVRRQRHGSRSARADAHLLARQRPQRRDDRQLDRRVQLDAQRGPGAEHLRLQRAGQRRPGADGAVGDLERVGSERGPVAHRRALLGHV